jgi:hypothetical protein
MNENGGVAGGCDRIRAVVSISRERRCPWACVHDALHHGDCHEAVGAARAFGDRRLFRWRRRRSLVKI